MVAASEGGDAVRRRCTSDTALDRQDTTKSRSRNLRSYSESSVDGICVPDELPDLTCRLVRAGIYEDYLGYRKNYWKWRKGGSHGARGEVSDVGKTKEQDQHDASRLELWFPTPQKFRFFFTVSYWQAILTLEGCLFFTFSSFLPYLNCMHASSLLLMQYSNMLGACLFTAATYCCYLQLINLQSAEAVQHVPTLAHWRSVLQRVRLDTFVGAMVYLVSSIVYNVMAIAAVIPSLGLSNWVSSMAFLGGFGFAIGGVCEVSHTCFGEHAPTTVSLLVASLNFVGGICFFCGGTAELFFHHQVGFMYFNYLVGSVVYTIAAVLLLVMWQSNDLGGTLLTQLSHAIRSGAGLSIGLGEKIGCEGLSIRVIPGSFSRRMSETVGVAQTLTTQPAKLSLRSVASLFIYCWLFVFSTIKFMMDWTIQRDGDHRGLEEVSMALIWVLSVKVILVVHSAITTLPNEQPYKLAMQSMQLLLVFASIVQTGSVLSSLPSGLPPSYSEHTNSALSRNLSLPVFHPLRGDEL